mmetsp:Transcript_3944/g.12242  ORF Transcript_3944/g.12242 Transcript_3944/m.12242 type:complete len:279 (-) Transcript_3944:33-869(-)
MRHHGQRGERRVRGHPGEADRERLALLHLRRQGRQAAQLQPGLHSLRQAVHRPLYPVLRGQGHRHSGHGLREDVHAAVHLSASSPTVLPAPPPSPRRLFSPVSPVLTLLPTNAASETFHVHRPGRSHHAFPQRHDHLFVQPHPHLTTEPTLHPTTWGLSFFFFFFSLPDDDDEGPSPSNHDPLVSPLHCKKFAPPPTSPLASTPPHPPLFLHLHSSDNIIASMNSFDGPDRCCPFVLHRTFRLKAAALGGPASPLTFSSLFCCQKSSSHRRPYALFYK